MEPPPASLEAMVRSRPGSLLPPERRPPWLWVSVLVLAVVALAYYLVLQQ